MWRQPFLAGNYPELYENPGFQIKRYRRTVLCSDMHVKPARCPVCMLWNRIKTTRMKRVAAKNSIERKDRSFHETVALNSFACILGAGRVKAACRPEKGGQK